MYIAGICYSGKYKIFAADKGGIYPPLRSPTPKVMQAFSTFPGIINNQITQMIDLSIAAAHRPYIESGVLLLEVAGVATVHVYIPCVVCAVRIRCT